MLTFSRRAIRIESTSYKHLLLFAALCVVAALGITSSQAGSSLAQTPKRPNIILLLTDDQDSRTLSVMPNVQRLLVKRGKTFPNATFAQPVCCPSRATLLRGQYPHNTGILDNGSNDGGEETFRRLGLDRSTYATWLDESGYKTGYFGKYLNGYENEKYIPPGWDRWVAADHVPATMRISNNGKLLKLGDRYETFDLAMKDYSVDFLKNNIDKRGPLFMTVSFSAPHNEHGKAKYEKRYADRFTTRKVSKTPNFNEQDRSDKPQWVRQLPSATPRMVQKMSVHYRARLRSLLTVDDAVEEYVRLLWNKRELDNTYIFYYSDNGFHMGNHALPDVKHGKGAKATPYTEDVEFPLIVRGPGVAPNTSVPRLVSNIDIAPTFADAANTSPTSSIDGRSLLPLMHGQDVAWRDALLVEGKHPHPWPEGWLATYKEVRTTSYAYHYYPTTGEEELYDLEADPYQLQSKHDDPTYAETKATLRSRLDTLKDCAGVTCKAADGGG
jgi:N-acetylglucosamine-6-sulfatase